MHSFRAEAYGNLAMACFLHRYLQFTETEVAEEVCVRYTCDNQALLKRKDEYNKYSSHGGKFYLAPDFDVVEATVIVLNALPFITIDAHVKGHQDESKQEEELSRDEILNIRSDQLATEWLTYQEDNPKKFIPHTFLPIPYMSYLKQGDRYVTSMESKVIGESMLSMEFKAYLMRLHKWEENILQDICWEAIAQARKKNDHTMTIFTIKLTTSWLPVGSNELRQGTRCTDECPLCKSRETVPHLYQCSQRRKWQVTLLEELSKELKKSETKAPIREEIIEGITAWFDNKAPPQHSPQTRIGWHQLMLGYINTEWINGQEKHYRRARADTKFTQEQYGEGN